MAQRSVQPLRNRCAVLRRSLRAAATQRMGQVSGITTPTMALPSGWNLALTRQNQAKETVMKLATIAFAALSAVIAAAPAHAGVGYNALTNNGVGYNALIGNGIAYNSLINNGVGYNSLINNGVAEQGSAGAKLVTCTTGAEPVCERTPGFTVHSVTLGNGRKLDLR
jgi:hypothetical protein